MLNSHHQGRASQGLLLVQEGAELGETKAHSRTPPDSSGGASAPQQLRRAAPKLQRSQKALIYSFLMEGKPVVLIPISRSLLPTGVSPTTIRTPLIPSCRVLPQHLKLTRGGDKQGGRRQGKDRDQRQL